MEDQYKKLGGGFLSLVMCSTFLLLAACQQTASAGNEGPQTSVTEQSPQIAQVMPPISGPKRTVAVGKFDAIGAFTSKYGNWDIGGGLAAMLTTSLVESDRFVVIERAELKEILGEQELKASGLVNTETGPKLGKLSGVQLLIYGAVTEFGGKDKGSGISFGFSGGSMPFSLGGAQEKAYGNVSMDIRVVDTTTGEVLESHSVSESIESSSFNLSVGYSGMSIGSDKFDKTPLGLATRKAINSAVTAIAVTANEHPWTGQVVDIDGKDIIINAGSHSGLQSGDMFMIERITKTFTDPATGQVLGTRSKELGVLTLSGVKDKMSFGGYSAIESEPPRRGDKVVIMRK